MRKKIIFDLNQTENEIILFKLNNQENICMKQVTLRQVAAAAGVSLSAASRAINQKPRISEAVRKRVLDVAKSMNYDLSNTISGKKHIGILVTKSWKFEQDFYTPSLLSHLYICLGKSGYLMQIFNQEELLNDITFNAVITIDPINAYTLEWGMKHSVPMIALNTEEKPLENIYSIRSNELQGMELAVNELWQAGHRKIGLFIVGDLLTWCNQERIKGFRRSMRKRGIEDPVIECYEKDYYESVGKLVSSGVSAIIAPAEGCGNRVAYILQLYKIRVPEDISLVVWEVPGITKYSIPNLSAVGQDFEAIAEGVEDLLESFNLSKPRVFHSLVDYKFFPRKSIARLDPDPQKDFHSHEEKLHKTGKS